MIRHATPQDLNALLSLENLCFTQDRMSRQSFRRLLTSQTAEILMDEENGRLLGSAVIFFRKNSKSARIYSFATHPDARGKGIAAKLCTAIEAVAKKRGCDDMILEVRPDNAPAIRFYEKQGYTPYGKYIQFYEDGSDALRMRKAL